VRGSRYGTYCDPRNGATVAGVFVPTALDQEFSAKWIADLEASFRMRHLTLGAGVQNVFDTYPETLRPENARAPVNPAGGFLAPGAIRYGTATPFGINGRFLYGRISYRF
jgi:iron complex outermembrane receptor protein